MQVNNPRRAYLFPAFPRESSRRTPNRISYIADIVCCKRASAALIDRDEKTRETGGQSGLRYPSPLAIRENAQGGHWPLRQKPLRNPLSAQSNGEHPRRGSEKKHEQPAEMCVRACGNYITGGAETRVGSGHSSWARARARVLTSVVVGRPLPRTPESFSIPFIVRQPSPPG